MKIRPNFRTNESPIYLLGKMYNGKEGRNEDDFCCSSDGEEAYFHLESAYDDSPRLQHEQSYAQFLTSFSQRLYFSYRKPFEPMTGARNGDLITSDCGWGCMIRCAQMLLAQTLLLQMTNPMTSYYSNIQISDKCNDQ